MLRDIGFPYYLSSNVNFSTIICSKIISLEDFTKRGGWLEGEYTNLDTVTEELGRYRGYTRLLLIDLLPELQEKFPHIDTETLLTIVKDARYQESVSLITFDPTIQDISIVEVPIYKLEDQSSKIRNWFRNHIWCEKCNKMHKLPNTLFDVKTITSKEITERIEKIMKTKMDTYFKNWRRRHKFPKAIKLAPTCFIWSETEVLKWINHNVIYLVSYQDKQSLRQQRKAEKFLEQFLIPLQKAYLKISPRP